MKKNIYKNIIKYRTYLNIHKFKLNFFNIKKFKYILVCDFNLLNSLGFKLLKPYFLKLQNLQKYLPYKFLLNFECQNYNFFKFNKNLIYFLFNTKYELNELITIFKKLTLIPFLFYPLFIFNIKKNKYLSFNNFNLKNLLKLNKIELINNFIITILKKNIFKLLITLNFLKKNCQH